jgi:hypothetical protein
MDAFLNEMLGGPGNRDARERFRSLWDVSLLALYHQHGLLTFERSTKLAKLQNQNSSR